MVLAIGIKLILVLTLVLVDIVLVRSILFGAPYAPSTQTSINHMIALAKLQPGEQAVDLGSGDGRVVLALAEAGVHVDGYETNWALVWWSRWRIQQAGLNDLAHIYHRSYWPEDLLRYSVVTVFGMTHIMAQLERKLRHELKPGARVLANSFAFPQWLPAQTDQRVYCYVQTDLLH